MINLLPNDVKTGYRYARRNRRLVKWVTSFAMVLVGAWVLTGGGVWYLKHTADTYATQAEKTNDALKSQNLAATQHTVTEISNNLKLVVQVLSKEILFPDLLQRLGSVTPANAILTNLTIAQAQSGIDITAQTSDYTAATQLQINLSDPKNQIFAKADIVSINCGADTTSDYPCTVNIRALFSKDNPFLFINTKVTP